MATGNNKKLNRISDPQSLRTENNVSDKPHTFKRLMPFYFYTPTIIIALAAAIKSGTFSPLAVFGMLIAGWLSWGFVEYAIHRFVLHRRNSSKNSFRLPGNRTHLAHHKNPSALERLYVPLHEGVPIALAFWFLAWLVTGSWQAAAFLYTGFILGYLFYELLDFEAHHGSSRNPLMRYYKNYHLQHHLVDAKARYGVTSPLFDYLFGTYQLRQKNTRRANRLEAQKSL